jgi:hypothetical protein
MEKIGYICSEEKVESLTDFFSGRYPVKTADEMNAEFAREHSAEVVIDKAHPCGQLGLICIGVTGKITIAINPNKE